MAKKKVSFDIDEELLADIKAVCSIKKEKMADFFRDASLAKLKNEKNYLQIFIPLDGKIHHFAIRRDNFEVDLFEAGNDMKINVGAKCEGVLRLKNGVNYDGKNRLFEMIQKHEKIQFYTTDKYC